MPVALKMPAPDSDKCDRECADSVEADSVEAEAEAEAGRQRTSPGAVPATAA